MNWQIKETDFELAELFRQTLPAMASRAALKGLELICNLPESVPQKLVGDAARLREVIANLAENAIRFTERGEIVVSVATGWETEDEVALVFSVSGAGTGVPTEQPDCMHDPSSQPSISVAGCCEAMGPGLATSVRLIELMGGRMSVQSDVARGSTFYFTLPLRVQPQTPRLDECLNSEEIAGKSVLLIEDNATNRWMLQERLETWGMQAVAVDGAEAAVARIGEAAETGRPYDVVLSDTTMPGIDGFELVRRIRAKTALPIAIIVMLCSSDQPGDIRRWRQLGVNGYLLKPVIVSEFHQAILRAVCHRGVGETPAASSKRLIETLGSAG
jgi:CheY-like chemotaxis protein